ncbi:hypothetical protein [Geitlerinema sp. PCC 7407]|uniref:hypothetical protein n=1 Tax=Geitlerinema sp. PCC 7407 TaxID=1173025 RepID=UPI00029F85A4|nr:hypothetical protein [Geitlerinema sp. PCC 7407]AFY65676.1 hypothetical protein GEI7407_1179 [Geitlerinema sp. PCC 7407]
MKLNFDRFAKYLAKGFWVVFLAVFASVSLSFTPATAPSFAAPNAYKAAIEQDVQQVDENRLDAYESAKETVNSRNGIEKEYEENEEAYLEEHPEEGGLMSGAKQVLEKLSSSDSDR